MTFLKRLTAALLVIMVTLPTADQKAVAGVAIPEDVSQLGLYFVDNFQLGSMPPQLYAVGSWSDATSYLMCKSISDTRCLEATKIFGIADLDLCTSGMTTSCIADVWAVSPSGKKIPGKFLKSVQLNEHQSFDEIAASRMPGSHALGGIWSFEGVTNSLGSQNYFVAVQDRINGNKKYGETLDKAKFDPDNFVSGIVPIKEISGEYGILKANDIETGNGAWGSAPTGPTKTPDGIDCVVTDRSYCAIKAQFPEGYRFGMSIQLGQKPTGWFSGRLGLPVISTKENGAAELISIEAAPLLVPRLDFVVPNKEIPEAARKLAFNGVQYGRGGTRYWQIVGEQSDPMMMSLLTAFVPAFKDTASGTDSIWSFKSMVGGSESWGIVQNCSQDIGSFGGLVTSNALTYSDGAPTFDKSTGELKYKVASPHFRENGTVAQGTYDLAIRSKVVRCLYNFSNAPIQATISILNEGGQNQIATTIINERDGWLYLSAKGYTFSSPTISVKITQEEKLTNTASGNSASTNSSKKTITCFKGKTFKKITGTKPACPKGYKQKQ